MKRRSPKALGYIVRGATGGDDIELPVAIEIGEDEVFASHPAVVHRAVAPVLAFGIERGPKMHADFGFRFSHRAPADDDLIASDAEQIATGESVTIDQVFRQN